MAKIVVDEEKCVGCGLCVNNCPDCFELNDEGIAKVKNSDCDSCDINDTISQCPVEAITVEG
ncbi:MAG: ferredoxin [Candidatus Omnitrophica bacterium]|nr:ferredoxin [Candidatus Omnitrophota bacterium]